jgi:hypothetical protein
VDVRPLIRRAKKGECLLLGNRSSDSSRQQQRIGRTYGLTSRDVGGHATTQVTGGINIKGSMRDADEGLSQESAIASASTAQQHNTDPSAMEDVTGVATATSPSEPSFDLDELLNWAAATAAGR